MPWERVTFVTKNQKLAGQIKYENDKISLKFPYSKVLLTLVKGMDGRKWNPEDKSWTAINSFRTLWMLSRMLGKDPFVRYDQPLLQIDIPDTYQETAWKHQVELFRHALTRKQAIIAGEAGSGKTLVAIMVCDYLLNKGFISDGVLVRDAWFVGPKSAVAAVSRELSKWNCSVKLRMFTYDALVKHVEEYKGSAPKVFIIDEASRIKTWSAQRTQAVRHVTNCMREEHGDECYILPMSGTPSPKTPVDWWPLVEVTCPGFLIENSVSTLRYNLAITEERESISGGKYPHMLGWRDDSNRCNACGKYKEEHILNTLGKIIEDSTDPAYHLFVPSVNEVERLARRLDGLVMRVFKRDCLDLPEHIRRIIKVKPSMELIRKARQIKESNIRAPQKLMQLRELSDGFQYVKDEDGNESVELFPTPKWGFVEWFLDNYEEAGRVVIWGAFTQSIDMLTSFLTEHDWIVLQIDGRGSKVFGKATVDEALSAMDFSHKQFQALRDKYPKLAVVAHPKAGGMSYTFTGAPAALYYGNDFNGEDKQQSYERIHRGGMDANRGATTFELVALPEDLYVIDNLAAKRSLQAITMKDLEDYSFDPSICELFDEGAFL